MVSYRNMTDKQREEYAKISKEKGEKRFNETTKRAKINKRNQRQSGDIIDTYEHPFYAIHDELNGYEFVKLYDQKISINESFSIEGDLFIK